MWVWGFGVWGCVCVGWKVKLVQAAWGVAMAGRADIHGHAMRGRAWACAQVFVPACACHAAHLHVCTAGVRVHASPCLRVQWIKASASCATAPVPSGAPTARGAMKSLCIPASTHTSTCASEAGSLALPHLQPDVSLVRAKLGDSHRQALPAGQGSCGAVPGLRSRHSLLDCNLQARAQHTARRRAASSVFGRLCSSMHVAVGFSASALRDDEVQSTVATQH